MSKHFATTHWSRAGANFLDNRYSREHEWRFDGGLIIPGSSSPHVVPVPLSNAANIDPEEGFIASISSCHMLWFLSTAAEKGFVVEEYTDEAEGIMEKNAEGKWAVTKVTLRPKVLYVNHLPTPAEQEALHHEAHSECFIANSVKSEVTVEAAEPTLA